MKKTKLQKAVLIAVCVIFAIYSVTLIYPFFWLGVNSFKAGREFVTNLFGMPDNIIFDNYTNAFNLKVGSTYLMGMMGNSIILVTGGVALSMFISSCSAYALSKFKFKGSAFIYNVAIAVMLVPTTGALAATYKLMQVTGLFGTRTGMLIQYSGGFGFAFLMLYNYFKSISWSYAEAAMIDGANNFTVFFKVMLPQAAAPISALAIITAINYWNDFFGPYMFLKNKPTLAVGLQLLLEKMSYGSNWPSLFAVMILAIIPILLVFIIFRKQIMESSLSGGLKG